MAELCAAAPDPHLFSVIPVFFSIILVFFVIPSLFFCHSGEGRNPSFSCAIGIAKEREARASFTGFLLSQEWRAKVFMRLRKRLRPSPTGR